jgi:dUTP pyrophosphatase
MSLYIYVFEPHIRSLYKQHLSTNHRYTDSGFDLMLPGQTIEYNDDYLGQTIHTGIIVAAKTESGEPAPSLLLPRSSITKTPLRLSNSIGLIDMGYRGEIMAKCDCMDADCVRYSIQEGTRLFQLVQHNFMPWKNIIIVENFNDLPYAVDNRGSGGFGSTG